MQFFISFITGFGVSIIRFLLRYLSIGTVKFLFTFTLFGLLTASIILFATKVIDFILFIWNLIKETINMVQNPNITGNAFGINLGDLSSNIFGFLNATGILDAFSVSFDLFIMIISLYIIIMLIRLEIYLYKNHLRIILDLFNLANPIK